MLILSVTQMLARTSNCYAAISTFLFYPLTFLLLFPFYNPDTVNLHVLMVLSIGGITNARLLPCNVVFPFLPHHTILQVVIGNPY